MKKKMLRRLLEGGREGDCDSRWVVEGELRRLIVGVGGGGGERGVREEG